MDLTDFCVEFCRPTQQNSTQKMLEPSWAPEPPTGSRRTAGPAGRASYQLTRTSTTPWDGGARRAKVALATSTTRPTTNGPRDTTRQVAVAPAAVLKYKVAPMGAALSAQVPVGMVSNQLATPYCTRSDVVVVTTSGGSVTVGGGDGVLTTPRFATATGGAAEGVV